MFRSSKNSGLRWLLALSVIELLLLSASLYVAARLRYAGAPEDLARFTRSLVSRSLVFAVVLMLGLAALGQYQLNMRTSWFGLMARQAVGFGLGTIMVVVVYYALPWTYVGRGVLGIALVVGFVLLTCFRLLFQRLTEVEGLKHRILILGAGPRAAEVHSRMRRRADRRGFNVVGFLPRASEAICVPQDYLLDPQRSLLEWVNERQVDEVVVGVEDRRGNLPMSDLLELRQLGVGVTDLTSFVEREAGRLQLSFTDPSWLVFSGGFDSTLLRRFSKRSFDLLAAVVVLLLTWPLMLLTALCIRLESGAGQPILYRQERVGARGKTFWLNKFRSMATDAERDGIARWASKNDDRVTRVGRFIRKTRLDELPQLWNVVKGEMSFIGPRPERPQFVADLSRKIRYYEVRHCLKPGLAGWAQLRYAYGASDEDAAEKLKYDLYYVKNHNLLFDLLILIQTVEVVLFGRGAR
ncbi:TIGR03013 family XrtA/PEP-CTERM system glycosyltransferase [Dyella sp.]|jgi:sugar transferase (PEP-CTERM system associated)|uniref:TIGR03013 family XrtA/PEP-CTERM system glycosyltransferase n=1 Tax=Dyella sp. TaxID=1869338 RepID=UPI002D778A67|nr:TIGR03013 family XrtA/PEP-CTERM system glycosyltransferase [Dyella sp.]HET6432953.1 TIGR03013 family XrtA/PEP-CTERM system glycosyltransferase [Dyella sp.]